MEGQVEKPEDVGPKPSDMVRRWLLEIDLADRAERKWRKAGKRVVELYKSETDTRSKRFNLLWSNTETLKPALYSATPRPNVERRFHDKDPVARDAAQILERGVSFLRDDYDFDSVMEDCVQDSLLPGRGVAWIVWEQYDDDEGVLDQRVWCEHVEWDDFRMSPAKCWEKVRWTARKHLMTRKELVAQFGAKGKKVTLDQVPDSVEEREPEEVKTFFKRALVWEIWDKDKRERVFVSPGFKDSLLSVEPDPLKLQDFFPCPKPLYSVRPMGDMVPTPEYRLYQDQAKELDRLTNRIDRLVDALKVRGVYNAAVAEFSRLLRGDENELIPSEDWSTLAEKGGLEGNIAFLPIEQIAKVLAVLYEQRAQLLNTIYQITGISDIIRGATDPKETATAQRMKGQFGSLRLQPRQKEVARFARDLYRLKAEIISEHFEPQMLSQMTGMQVSEEISALLNSDALRSFRVDIETDSTVAPDDVADKQAVTEYLAAAGQFINLMAPLVNEGQLPPDVAKTMLLWASRRFKVSREIETVLDRIGDQVQDKPDPEQMKMQAEQQAEQAKMQLEGQKLQLDQAKAASEAEAKREEMALNAQLKREELQTKVDLEREKMVAQHGPSIVGQLEKIQQMQTDAAAQNAQTLQAVVQQMQQTTMVMAEVIKSLNAPKRIVRDAQGRPTGVAPVPQAAE